MGLTGEWSWHRKESVNLKTEEKNYTIWTTERKLMEEKWTEPQEPVGL